MNKKILAILMVLICALSISTVSATGTGDSSSDVPGTFAELNTTISGETSDTVTLNKNYAYSGAGDVGTINISKDLTIDGKGHTIDASGQVSVFNITGGNVIIKNITFINGKSETGGAITNNGNLMLIDCKFINNTGEIRGGAIYNNGTLTATNCVFDGNDITERNHAGVEFYGGAAIYSTENSTTNVMNSEIKNNVKNFKWDIGDGESETLYAAICVRNNLTINNCTFTENYGRYGGAIAAIALNVNKMDVIIKESTFNNNYALYGGAVYVRGTNLAMTMSNCNFTDNGGKGKGDVSPNDNEGGAIEIFGNASASIENCNFINHSAKYGGTIGIGENNGVNITDCSFINSSAKENGGVMDISTKYTENYVNKVIISNSSFINNNAGIHGGSIYTSLDITVVNSSFVNNTAVKYGGAIYTNSKININDSIFANNTAKQYGGAVCSFKNATVVDSVFDDNTAVKSGGAIYNYMNITVVDSVFANNAAKNGGAIYNSKNAAIVDSVFDDNAAKQYGGAIYNYMNITVVDSVFDNNNAAAGADIVSPKVSGASITLNNVTSDGKGIFVSSGVTTNTTNTLLATKMTLKIKNVVVGDNVTISGKVNLVTGYMPKVNGTIVITIDGISDPITINVENGVFSTNIKNLPVGNYKATLVFTGKDYISCNATANFAVNKIATTITINPIGKINVGDSITVSGNTTGIANNTNITITVNGKEYNAVVVDGKFSEEINDSLPEGTAKITASYTGNENITDAEDTINVTVGRDSSVITIDDIDSVIVGENVTVSGTIVPTVANITIKANGKVFNVTVTNGTFYYNIGNFTTDGNKTITIEYAGNEKYIACTKPITFTVVKKATSINIDDINGTAGDIVVDGAVVGIPEGAVITVSVDGKNYAAVVNGSKFSAIVKDLAAGNYTIKADYTGNDEYASASATAKLGLSHIVTGIVVSDVTGIAGDVVVGGSVVGIPEGAVITVSVGTSTVTAKVNGSKFSVSVNLAAGNYTVEVDYAGDEFYAPADATAKLGLSHIVTGIVVSDINGTAGDIVVDGAVVGIPEGAVITVSVDGKNYAAVVNGSKFSAIVKDLAAGNYTVEVDYAGDEFYASASATAKLGLSHIVTGIVVSDVTGIAGDVVVGGSVVGIPEGAVITVSVGTSTVTAKVNGSKFSVSVNLAAGNYTVEVDYAGDEFYAPADATAKLSLTQIDTDIAIDDLNIFFGEDPIIVGNVSGIPENATVIISVGGKEYNAIVNGTKFLVTVENLTLGSYNVAAVYEGNITHKATSANATVTVLPVIVGNDTVLYFKNGTKYVALFLDGEGNPLAGANIQFNINGVVYNRTTDANGTASLNINLAPGNYIITATNKDNGAVHTNNITVLPVIVGNDTVLYFKNGTKYVALFLDGEGNPLAGAKVQFNVNGVFYNRTTDANGTASLNINLAPGNYIVTAINTVNGALHANNITVLPTIIGEDIVKYYKNGTQYVVKVLDGKGNALANQTVEYNINGVFYKRTTDVNGTAVFNINLGAGNSEPKDYIVTAVCNGCIVSNNVTVLPVLTAEDFNETFQAGKKFIANIVDGEGKPLEGAKIQFNINGVFYNRTSDVNGTVGLNINLAPGEYIITTICNDNGAVISNKVTVTPKV